ncbi:MAG: cell wall biosynthesis glycosyltransferase [Thermoanaerobaculaceae bacterium]|nr:cell wall biosynthesis glycosyltransferase [Thermoanaerobaculaceae bacterium]MDI9620487.1 glycosyl transferase family 2 [Acidobacteriota bacterium]HPW56267.1 cell wall biosynthesis glycosyltransferase [Thermoanaerobaculaceae bacterium]
MIDLSFLPESLRRQLADVGQVDVLVGIPSYNNARTIGHVVRAVQGGLARHFPEQRALLVNSDGGSTDGTPDVVRQASIASFETILAAHPLRAVHRIVTPYHGIPGKGSALRTVFAAAAVTGAKACAVVDSDLRSITPEWIELLLEPVLVQGLDFIAPLYHRHKYDGTITNSIVYPLTRALYGARVRQPIGGDFGFSGRLAEHYLTHDVWSSDVARYGIDIWMTTTAITGGYKIGQSFLGAKIHDAKDPSVDLSAMLMQVTGAVLSLMGVHAARWREVRASHPVPVFGFEYAVGLEPVPVNLARMLERFRTGARELGEIWQHTLHPATAREIAAVAAASDEEFAFPPALWVRTMYDFAVAHQHGRLNREHLLRSLTPLYLGRTAAFVVQTRESGAEEVEQILEELCLQFEREKPYLLERWDETGGGR